jgi:hypothetical protein
MAKRASPRPPGSHTTVLILNIGTTTEAIAS